MILDAIYSLVIKRRFLYLGSRSFKITLRRLKHVIHSLAKKPNAFKYLRLRENLIHEGDFSLLWKQLTIERVSDKGCHYMVQLLLIAHNYNCEQMLGGDVLKDYE